MSQIEVTFDEQAFNSIAELARTEGISEETWLRRAAFYDIARVRADLLHKEHAKEVTDEDVAQRNAFRAGLRALVERYLDWDYEDRQQILVDIDTDSLMAITIDGSLGYYVLDARRIWPHRDPGTPEEREAYIRAMPAEHRAVLGIVLDDEIDGVSL